MPLVTGLKQMALPFLATIFLLSFFIGSPNLIHSQSFREAWNLGHIAAYVVWSLLLLRCWLWLASSAFWKQCLTVLLLCIFTGGLLEFFQSAFGRYPSWNDMGRNLIGSLFAISFLFPKRHALEARFLRLLQAVTIILFIIALIPLSHALINEWIARHQFPIIADFETPFELDRWSGNAELSIDRSHTQSGSHALKIELNTDQYSGATLHHFPGNWKGWQWISFSIYNPDSNPISMVCKINDYPHDISGYRYADRFNRVVELNPGWNRIRISIKDIQKAPANRSMDLAQITEINIFSVRLPTPRTLYLDYLVLEP